MKLMSLFFNYCLNILEFVLIPVSVKSVSLIGAKIKDIEEVVSIPSPAENKQNRWAENSYHNSFSEPNVWIAHLQMELYLAPNIFAAVR